MMNMLFFYNPRVIILPFIYLKKHMSEIHLTDATFDGEVIQSKGVVLVDFWAEWCGPCKMVGPVISQIADEMAGKVKVCKLDVDANTQKAQEHGIMSIPTMMIFKDGKMVDMFVGARTKEDIVGRLNKALEGK
jgi:thioredoxin 1